MCSGFFAARVVDWGANGRVIDEAGWMSAVLWR